MMRQADPILIYNYPTLYDYNLVEKLNEIISTRTITFEDIEEIAIKDKKTK